MKKHLIFALTMASSAAFAGQSCTTIVSPTVNHILHKDANVEVRMICPGIHSENILENGLISTSDIFVGATDVGCVVHIDSDASYKFVLGKGFEISPSIGLQTVVVVSPAKSPEFDGFEQVCRHTSRSFVGARFGFKFSDYLTVAIHPHFFAEAFSAYFLQNQKDFVGVYPSKHSGYGARASLEGKLPRGFNWKAQHLHSQSSDKKAVQMISSLRLGYQY